MVNITKEQILEKIEQARVENAESLDFSISDLKELPPEIGQLINLKEIYLHETQLSSLPPEIGQLTNLQTLNLHKTQLSSLPPEIGQLTNLQRLDVDNTLLSSLPPEIGKLTNLQTLWLSNTQLSSLPPEIGQLTNLQTLALYETQLSSLPPEIGQLINLQLLALFNNQLSSLPSKIGQLTNLKEFYLFDTKLSSLSPEIGQLTNLQLFHLSDTQLSSLPKEIKYLYQLELLDLNNTPLANFEFDVTNHPKLVVLDLRNTPVSQQLSTNLGRLVQKQKGLFIPNDSPPLPPELNDSSAIYRYLREVKKEARPLNEAKLILVGEGAVGKTSLVNRLVRNNCNENEKKTNGIAIEKWSIQTKKTHVKLNIWDFGGQEIMHATHQFFLTKRSIYLLVLDARRGEQESRLEYWLKLIQSFGEDSPIIVVINKTDQHPLDLNRRGLKNKYERIVDFIDISCKNNQNISQLKQCISDTLETLPHIHDLLPKSWFDVKETLEQNTANFIDYQRYVDICRENGIKYESMQKMLLGFLHDLGIVLNFQNDHRLKDTNVLKPEWVTQGIYKLLNNNILFQNKGVLTCQDMQNILDQQEYPIEKHQFLLNMMEKFELCFAFEEKNTFLIPELLQKDELDLHFDEQNSLQFHYHYDILPSSFFLDLS